MAQVTESKENDNSDLMYGLEERPPWYLLILLSFQDFLLSVTSFIPNPLVIAVPMCMADDVTGMAELIGTIFFVGGLCSLLQTTIGIRLPIVQGPSASFIAPVVILLKTKTQKCPVFDFKDNSTVAFLAGSEEHRSIWTEHLLELQGSLMLASLLEIFLGFTGLVGVLTRYIGPLTTSTAISLIGLSLVPHATEKGATHWWICFMTIALIIVFSQYLRNVTITVFGNKINVFMLFPVLLAMVISWLVCLVLTLTDVLPDTKGKWGYEARTDIKTEALVNARWFMLPYPGQWGIPTFSPGAVMAMLASVLAITLESVGDYRMCAKLFGAPQPPPSALNRGLGVNGICCLLGGAWGTGSGLTSFSHNIAAIGLTRVGSRVVVQVSAIMLMVAGCLGKVGALFSTVPDPIVGAMIYCMFGMVVAVGISNLEMADLSSSRNLFVFGFSIFFACSVPKWVEENPFSFGDPTTNEILTIFCSTSMLVGGGIAFFLDNTIPGTLEERGIILHGAVETDSNTPPEYSSYDLPGVRSALDKTKLCRYIPFCPGFLKDGDGKDIKTKMCKKSESYGSINNCDVEWAEWAPDGTPKRD